MLTDDGSPSERNAAWRRQFELSGFVRIPGFLAELEVAAANHAKNRFLRDVVPKMPQECVYYEHRGDRRSLKQVQRMFEHDDFFQAMLIGSRFDALAAMLLGEPVVGQNLQYFDKPPGVGKPTPPHQDGFYFMLQPPQAITCWLALQDVVPEQGCLRYIPGSHLRGLRPHHASEVLGFSQSIADYGPEDEAREVPLPCRAGDLLVHHALTIHCAGDNRHATESRQALGLIYYGASARQDEQAHARYQRELAARLQQQGRI